MSGQTVLILGGGVGGVVAANRLRKRLGRRHRIILVDREPSFRLAASFLWVMTGARRPEQISRPLARLERRGIEVLRGEVERIDPEQRTAIISGQAIAADHLVVALGAEFAPEAVPGLGEAGLTFCTLDGATRLRDALDAQRSGRILVLTAAPAYKCPAAPYEAATCSSRSRSCGSGCERATMRERVRPSTSTTTPRHPWPRRSSRPCPVPPGGAR